MNKLEDYTLEDFAETVTSIQTLAVNPKDTIVVKITRGRMPLTHQLTLAVDFNKIIKKMYPDNNVLVMDENCEIYTVEDQ